ncbi:MAG: hypothetical protein NT126_08240 [Bacteroidetes bacterium]|nr:hypothetical protein [Bacteroidota bacterium]
MSFPKNIRTVFANIQFRKEIQKNKHKRETVGFDEAKKIGLLYDATDDYNYEVVKQYVKTVRGMQKEILALGFVDKKELPPSQFAQYGLDFFTRKNLNWQMIPDNPIVTNFINEKFDILVNLTNNKCFPLRYIAAVSHARFRVGRFDKKNVVCYDMMIHVKGEPGIKNFIEEVENYLRQIKTSHEHQ